MATCWCYVFFTPAPRLSEVGREEASKTQEHGTVMRHAILLASLTPLTAR